jgi:hypothetical protein
MSESCMVKKQMPSLHHALNISLIRSEMWKADDSSSNISFPICQNNKPKCMYFNPETQTDHVN